MHEHPQRHPHGGPTAQRVGWGIFPSAARLWLDIRVVDHEVLCAQPEPTTTVEVTPSVLSQEVPGRPGNLIRDEHDPVGR